MADKLPRIQVIFDRYKKASLDKHAVVELRITYDRKQKYINTGIMLLSNQWQKGTIVDHPEALALNNVLSKMLHDVNRILFGMIQDSNIDINAITLNLKKEREKSISFLDFCKQRVSIKKYGKSKGTQERYSIFLKYFIKWGKIVSFEDVTEASLIAYDKWLESKGMNIQSRWGNHHRYLNSLIQDACDENFISKNSYKRVNISRSRGVGGINKFLSVEEFKLIRDTTIKTAYLERARDLFVFQTYTCLRYSDLALFDVQYIKEINGMKTYVRNSKKTHQQFTVPLLSPVIGILEKYNNHLPIISLVKYNLFLKRVAIKAGVNKPISSHWARHTGATMLLNEGVDMKIVSKICGHSSTRITEQIYAKLLDETVVDAIQSLNI